MSTPGPGLAAVIAELAERLPPGHVESWALVLRTAPDLDATVYRRLVEAGLIEARPGVAVGSWAARLMAAWQAAIPPVSGTAIALALESAAYVAADAAARSSDVVVSGPSSDSEAVRLTSSVIGELVHDCRESLLIVTFAAFGVAEVVPQLQLAVRPGVRIDIVSAGSAEKGGAL